MKLSRKEREMFRRRRKQIIKEIERLKAELKIINYILWGER